MLQPGLLNEAILECSVNNCYALMPFMALFENVMHKGLLYKLFQFGVTEDVWFVLVILDWYNKLSSAVIWDNFQTHEKCCFNSLTT